MLAENDSEAPTTEQKGKSKASTDEPVQEDRLSPQDSTYGTGAAYPTPTTPLFPAPQAQDRQPPGGLTVVEEDEKLEHSPAEDTSPRCPPTIIHSAMEGEASSTHRSPEAGSADDADDNKSIPTNEWADPGTTTRFRLIDWRTNKTSTPDAQRVTADLEVSPTHVSMETPSTNRRSMRLSEWGSAASRARSQVPEEGSDKIPSSDVLGALSEQGENVVDHRAETSIRLAMPEERSSTGEKTSNTLSSSPCRRNRSGRAGASRRPPHRAPRQAATEDVWSGPEECLPNLRDATDPQSLGGIDDPFADNYAASDHHPRVNSGNQRSAAANKKSVAMSDPQSLLSALNATPMRTTRSRSDVGFRRLSVTHSEVVRARSEERRKGLKENEVPPKARAQLGIQAPVRQVPNPADPTSHLPPAFAGQNATGPRQGNSMPRSVIPLRFKPPAPAEVAARGRRRVTSSSQITSATTAQDQAQREGSCPRGRVERWVYGENHPAEFHESDEDRHLLQDMNGRERNELQPFASAEGLMHPSSDPPPSDEEKKKKEERKKKFWAFCRRKAAKKLFRRNKNKKS